VTEVDHYRTTCFHEAAHVVFALKVCGFSLQYVSADDSYSPLKAQCSMAMPTIGAATCTSGALRGAARDMGEIRPESWEAFREDAVSEAEDESMWGDTFDLIEELYGMRDPEEKYTGVVSDTEETVRELWPEITAVSEILMKLGRLEGDDEVARIVERAREQRERGG